MDKKGTKKSIVIDDKEDLEIKKVASSKTSTPKFLLYVLIFLFCIMLGSSIIFIKSYNDNKDKNYNEIETIEINTKKNRVLITNNGELVVNVTSDSFEVGEDLVLEKISSIELTTNEEAEKNGKIIFDVKYDILENDFERNEFSTLDSDVLVKFSYSFDKENWKYINNVISTTESTISPMMGNSYDVSGIKSNLKIATDYELTSEIGKTTKMYWRSEVVFKNKSDKKISNNYKANFKIDYKEND